MALTTIGHYGRVAERQVAEHYCIFGRILCLMERTLTSDELKIQSPATVQSNSGRSTVVSEVHLVELLMKLAITLLQKCLL
jgi:hypothetical protein